MRVEAITKESSMEISPLNYRVFDEEIDNPLKIKTSKFFFNEDGVYSSGIKRLIQDGTALDHILLEIRCLPVV